MTFTPVVRRLESRAIARGNALVVDGDRQTLGQVVGIHRQGRDS